MLKYVTKIYGILEGFKAKASAKRQQTDSKATARPIFDFWAQMETPTENISYMNLIKHANLQLLSPKTGCLDKIQQF